MERAWVFETLAVTVAEVDFLDPALAGEPDARERGVRVELRPVEAVTDGSIYVSPTVTMRPAVCRIDLLESRPGAADRMHWHPVMAAGEPGDRLFDRTMPTDPLAWLADRLRHVHGLLEQAGVEDVSRHHADATAIAAEADDIVAAARVGLARVREPWPVVRRDHRGMAATRPQQA
jgi:hypothetical protein